MKSPHWGVLIAVSVLSVLTAGVLLSLPWLARESLFEFTARAPKNKNLSEPEGPMNGSRTFRHRE
jgi:hypothetical protein